MTKIPNIGTRTYDTLGLGLVDFECDNMTWMLLGLIPEDATLVAIIINHLDTPYSRSAKEQLDQHKIPFEGFRVSIPGWFGRKYWHDCLRLTIKYANRDLYSQLQLIEYGHTCISFVFDKNVSVVSQVYLDLFRDKSWGYNDAKHWLPWAAKAINATGCKYLAVPDYESPELTIFSRLVDLDALLDAVKKVFSEKEQD